MVIALAYVLFALKPVNHESFLNRPGSIWLPEYYDFLIKADSK